HLRELGHERIGLAVGPKRFVPVQRKAEQFRRLMAPVLGSAAAVDELIVHTLFSVEGGHSAAWTVLERGCTGVVRGGGLGALGAARGARRRGREVPGACAVGGYGESPLIAFTDPPVPASQQQVSAMAAAAVRTLLDEIAGVEPPAE